MRSRFLFVYGTLMENGANAMAEFVKQNCELVGPGSFPGKLYEISWYPGAIYDEDASTVVPGTLYEIVGDRNTLFKKLDEYEGIGHQFEQPNEYKRDVINVSTAEGETVEAWVYLYNLEIENKTQIPSFQN